MNREKFKEYCLKAWRMGYNNMFESEFKQNLNGWCEKEWNQNLSLKECITAYLL